MIDGEQSLTLGWPQHPGKYIKSGTKHEIHAKTAAAESAKLEDPHPFK